jgi:trehalose-phosphatase
VIELAAEISRSLAEGRRYWLFLDYDGTLAPFAPTPDTILPDSDLIRLIERMARFSEVLRIVILSGRRFKHIVDLLPIPGVLLAGTYGVEFQTWEGEKVRLLDFEEERPFLDQVKVLWQGLVDGQKNFYIEDKSYALALHGNRADDQAARVVIAEAAEAVKQIVDNGTFRIMGGNKFIEVAPAIADKGQSVSTLLTRFPWPGAGIIYIGDDDKDEEAFKVVLKQGGLPIVVSENERPSLATKRLANPSEVRQWLETLVIGLENSQV